MAFVCEKIREEDREYFNSIGFTQIYGKPSKASWWAIDRERNIILISRGGMIDIRYVEYQLYYKEEFIKIRAIEKTEGDRFDNDLRITWIINKIEIPKVLVGQETEIKKIIEEAFISYGKGGIKPSQLLGIKVEIDAELEIV